VFSVSLPLMALLSSKRFAAALAMSNYFVPRFLTTASLSSGQVEGMTLLGCILRVSPLVRAA
jgi:hypothetical protein